MSRWGALTYDPGGGACLGEDSWQEHYRSRTTTKAGYYTSGSAYCGVRYRPANWLLAQAKYFVHRPPSGPWEGPCHTTPQYGNSANTHTAYANINYDVWHQGWCSKHGAGTHVWISMDTFHWEFVGPTAYHWWYYASAPATSHCHCP